MGIERENGRESRFAMSVNLECAEIFQVKYTGISEALEFSVSGLSVSFFEELEKGG